MRNILRTCKRPCEFFGSIDENRNVASGRQRDLDSVVFPFPLVELGEAFSQAMGFDHGDRIFGGVKYGLGAAEDFGRDGVLVKLFGFARKELIPHKSEQPRQAWPSGQSVDYALQFRPFRFGELGI